MTVDVALQAGHAAARLLRSPVLGHIELLLRERGEQQPKPLKLLRVEDAVKQLVVVHDGDELALRHVSQVRARGQVDWWRELRQEVLGQIKVQVKSGEVASLLPLDFINVMLGEDHAALGMIRMRQRQESLGKQVAVADFHRRHLA